LYVVFKFKKTDIDNTIPPSESLKRRTASKEALQQKLTLPAAYVKGFSTNSLAMLIGVAMKITLPK
jgi:hypothetical protein